MKLFKKVLPVVMALTLVLCSASSSFACTGVYAGAGVTDDGATYFGRSEDFGPAYGKVFEITPAATHKKGEIFSDVLGFSCPYPSKTCKYSIVRDTPDAWAEEYGATDANTQLYAEAGLNEYGVSMSATVSIYHNDKVEALDPMNWDGGISEMSMGTVILWDAKTAREGVENLLAIIDEYGCAEESGIFVADQTETWYVHLVSGHEYIALKMDPSKVSVVPNMMMLDQITVDENSDDMIVSKNFISLPKEGGFLITDTPEIENSIHVSKTYSKNYSAHSSYRAYQGMYVLNPELAAKMDPVPVDADKQTVETNINADETAAPGPFVLQFDPSKTVTLKTMIQVLQARGEGTAYDTNKDPSIDAIGNERQAENHIFQIRKDLPLEIATIQWQSMAPSEFSIFVPYYTALMTETPKIYYTESAFESDGSFYWIFDELATLANDNRATVASAVSEYFSDIQDQLIEQQKDVDKIMQTLMKTNPDQAAYAADKLAELVAGEIFDVASATLDEVKDYVASGATEPLVLKDKVEKLNYASNAKKMMKVLNCSLKAKSSAAKGSITVRWTVKNASGVQNYEVWRSTKKDSGYAKYATKGATKRTYTNTKNLKKGTRYYYKVRGTAVIDGVKVVSPWSTKAIRIAK